MLVRGMLVLHVCVLSKRYSYVCWHLFSLVRHFHVCLGLEGCVFFSQLAMEGVEVTLEAGAGGGPQYRSLPWPQRLVLTQTKEEEWVLTDVLTQASATLQGKQYCIVSLDGNALIVNEVTDDQFWPLDLLSLDVIRNGRGHRRFFLEQGYESRQACHLSQL